MKRFFFALTAAVLCTGLFLSPFGPGITTGSAAAPAQEGGPCGTMYTVQHMDNLYSIASKCGTTVPNILALNPSVKNPNLIYSGQVLLVAGDAPRPVYYTITYTVQAGDTVGGIAAKFGISIWALRAANPVLYEDNGMMPGQQLSIPRTASWLPTVTLSTTTADDNDELDVKISGFPAFSAVDVWLGEQGEKYAVVYDGNIAEDGTATVKIKIPTAANYGERWIVFVTTTSQKDAVAVYSPTINISY